MKTWKITVHTVVGSFTRTQAGDRNALMDALYDLGALGVTMVPA